MLTAMYEVPSDKTIKKCIITKEVVTNNTKPTYIKKETTAKTTK